MVAATSVQHVVVSNHHPNACRYACSGIMMSMCLLFQLISGDSSRKADVVSEGDRVCWIRYRELLSVAQQVLHLAFQIRSGLFL